MSRSSGDIGALCIVFNLCVLCMFFLYTRMQVVTCPAYLLSEQP